jgi:hypothetical protein
VDQFTLKFLGSDYPPLEGNWIERQGNFESIGVIQSTSTKTICFPSASTNDCRHGAIRRYFKCLFLRSAHLPCWFVLLRAFSHRPSPRTKPIIHGRTSNWFGSGISLGRDRNDVILILGGLLRYRRVAPSEA